MDGGMMAALVYGGMWMASEWYRPKVGLALWIPAVAWAGVTLWMR